MVRLRNSNDAESQLIKDSLNRAFKKIFEFRDEREKASQEDYCKVLDLREQLKVAELNLNKKTLKYDDKIERLEGFCKIKLFDRTNGGNKEYYYFKKQYMKDHGIKTIKPVNVVPKKKKTAVGKELKKDKSAKEVEEKTEVKNNESERSEVEMQPL